MTAAVAQGATLLNDAPGLQHQLVLDPAHPLHLACVPDLPTLAVVSIASLRARGESVRAELSHRHLTPEEQARAGAFAREGRRIEWLAGRLAVKYAVTTHLNRASGQAAETSAIEVRAVASGPRAGKPFVNAPVEVGLSHSGDFAIAACGSGTLGIDLECGRDVSPVLTKVLDESRPSGDPGGRLSSIPATLHWACKEAVLKHFGFGLRIDSREVVLTEWLPNAHFSWRPGPTLRSRTASSAYPSHGIAHQISGYSLALVWR
ncbi:4'-phosphopantetheinyl transferase family protein [Catenulispora pinisilvae]|uniref:4'-phosphopantetheinyl transferase family protein n=1 Tax=Catenulispora pinisilvae TaxID=2705253 RepID=UPI001E4B0146|nr:hypothetical protein [Catenulispora pinisilvae]